MLARHALNTTFLFMIPPPWVRQYSFFLSNLIVERLLRFNVNSSWTIACIMALRSIKPRGQRLKLRMSRSDR